MVKCANCSAEAIYTYSVSSSSNIHYCNAHLPRFLINQKLAGALPLVVPAAPETAVPKKSKTVTEDAPVEEPEVTEE
jgi:hypothetical protein